MKKRLKVLFNRVLRLFKPKHHLDGYYDIQHRIGDEAVERIRSEWDKARAEVKFVIPPAVQIFKGQDIGIAQSFTVGNTIMSSKRYKVVAAESCIINSPHETSKTIQCVLVEEV